MTIIKTGQLYWLSQLSGYKDFKARGEDYYFLYEIDSGKFDVYGKNQLMPVAGGNAKMIKITSIWDHLERTHQDSLDLEGKIGFQIAHNQ